MVMKSDSDAPKWGLQPFLLVMLRHLSVVLIFLLLCRVAATGLTCSPLSSTLSWVLAKPEAKWNWVAKRKNFCYIRKTLWCIAPLKGPTQLSCRLQCTSKSGTFGSFYGSPRSPINQVTHLTHYQQFMIWPNLASSNIKSMVWDAYYVYKALKWHPVLKNLAVSRALAAVSFILATLNSTSEECLKF